MRTLVQPQRTGALSRVSPIQAMRSESRLMPDQPLVRIAAKVSGEPIVTDVVQSIDGSYAQRAPFAKSDW
jgi:hypothetical protein